MIKNILYDLEQDGLILKNEDCSYTFNSTYFRVTSGEQLKDFYSYWPERSKEALKLPF